MIGLEARRGTVLPAYPEGGPTVLRIILGGRLRKLREQHNISRAAAGRAIRASESKISRMELGRVAFKERDLSDLLTLYGVSDKDDRATMLSLGRQANQPGWWHKYGDLLPGWFELYVGLEEAASLIRTYEVQFIPGLLQTRDYARAVTLLGHAAESSADVERRVDMRMTRQEKILKNPGGSTLWAVIDEAVFRRILGGPGVMRAQIEHLILMAARPNITVQIVPFEGGGHAAAGGPFTILRFNEPDLPDVVYMEQLSSALYLDDRDEVNGYMAVMDRLSVEAATREKTLAMLHRLLDEL